MWRLTGSLAPVRRGDGDPALRRTVHRLVAAATEAMDARRLNVAVSRLMELTTVLRQARCDPADPARREGAEALVRMLSCFAPFTAEEGWQRLGHEPPVSAAGWPSADPALYAEQTVTCLVQVDGRVRDRVEVPAGAGEDELRRLALAHPAVAGRTVARVVVRPPRLVNVVTAD